MASIENLQGMVGKTIAGVGISEQGCVLLTMTDGSRVLLVGDGDSPGIAFFGTSVINEGVVDRLIS